MVEVRGQRARIADVAREAGVSKTAVSFAFNSPEPPGPGDRHAHPRSRRQPRLPAAPRRPDAQPGPDLHDRGPDPAGPQRHLLEPVLRPVQRGRRAGRRGARLRPALHLAAPRLAGAARWAGRPSTASSRSACRTTTPRSSRSAAPACRSSSSTRPRCPEHGSVEIDDVGGARAAAEHILGARPPRRPGHRRRAAGARRRSLDPEGVTGRRLRGYREAFAAAESALDLPDERVVVGPASVDGGIAALHRAWEDGLRPTAVLAMCDVMAIGALRALKDLGLDVPRRRQRRRLRRHRPRPARGPPADDGAPADPSQGRGGGPPAPDRRGTTGSGQAGAPAAGDAAHRPRLERPGASPPGGGGRDPSLTCRVSRPHGRGRDSAPAIRQTEPDPNDPDAPIREEIPERDEQASSPRGSRRGRSDLDRRLLHEHARAPPPSARHRVAVGRLRGARLDGAGVGGPRRSRRRPDPVARLRLVRRQRRVQGLHPHPRGRQGREPRPEPHRPRGPVRGPLQEVRDRVGGRWRP